MNIFRIDDILQPPAVFPRTEHGELIFILGNPLVPLLEILVSALTLLGESVVQTRLGNVGDRMHIHKQFGVLGLTSHLSQDLVVIVDDSFVVVLWLEFSQLEQAFCWLWASGFDLLAEYI